MSDEESGNCESIPREVQSTESPCHAPYKTLSSRYNDVLLPVGRLELRPSRNEERDKISTNSAAKETETEMRLPISHHNRNDQYLSKKHINQNNCTTAENQTRQFIKHRTNKHRCRTAPSQVTKITWGPQYRWTLLSLPSLLRLPGLLLSYLPGWLTPGRIQLWNQSLRKVDFLSILCFHRPIISLLGSKNICLAHHLQKYLFTDFGHPQKEAMIYIFVLSEPRLCSLLK